MNAERVIYTPFYFLLAVVVVCLIVGAATGVVIISKFAVTLFAVVFAMFVGFLFVVACGCIFHDISKSWKDDPEQHGGFLYE